MILLWSFSFQSQIKLIKITFQLEKVILAPYPRLSVVEACAGMGTATYIMCRVGMACVFELRTVWRCNWFQW